MSTRTELADVLKAGTYSGPTPNVYEYAPDVLKAPALIIDEADPAIEVHTNQRLRLNFEVVVAVPRGTGATGQRNLERLRLELYEAIYNTPFKYGAASKGELTPHGDIELIMSRVDVTTGLRERGYTP